MRKRSKWFVWSGVALVAVGVCAAAAMGLLRHRGARQAADVAARIEAALPPRTVGAQEAYSVMQMPALNVEGEDFVALVEIPAYGVKLPLCNEWKTAKLYRYPCRFDGTVYDGSLIVGGGTEQLACLRQAQHGDEVRVTDMQGGVFTYAVTRIRRARHADTATLHSDAPLTLFVRDGYNMEYIIVECE